MDFLTVFRTMIPEYKGKTDEEILAMLEIVKPQISKKRMGSLYDQAACYLVAHYFAWQSIVADGGASSGAAVAGPIISEKEGDLARSYADNSSKDGGSRTDTLDKTAYGQEYRRLLKMRIFPALTRRGVP